MADYDSQEIAKLLTDYCDLRDKVVGITSPEQAKNSAYYGRFMDTQSRIRQLVLDGKDILEVLDYFRLPEDERVKFENLKEKVDGTKKSLKSLVSGRSGNFVKEIEAMIRLMDLPD